MSLNAFLHPRNPYRTRPDFKALATKFPEFRKVVTTTLEGKVKVDFTDREAVRVLTETLLANDFELDVRIPKGCLVPTLPLRMNYLLWIEDLVNANATFGTDSSTEISGLDVGVGASCVYPLLAAKKLGWKMHGTDIDAENLSSARQNVERNPILGSSIVLHEASGGSAGPLLAPVLQNEEVRCRFTMCNPPFHQEDEGESDDFGDSSREEAPREALNPEPPGKEAETKTRGGEVAMVTRMIAESREIAQRSAKAANSVIFTCMLGYKTSVKKVRAALDDAGKIKCAFTEFCQGKTMRWGVAWTFSPTTNLLDAEPSLLKLKQEEKRLHKPVPFKLQVPAGDDCKATFQRISEWLTAAQFSVKPGKLTEDKTTFTAKTFSLGWKNQRRKRREQQRDEDERSKKEEAAAASEPPTKRGRIEDNNGDEAMDTDDSGGRGKEQQEAKKGDVQLCLKFFMQRNAEQPESSSLEIEVQFLDGEVGKDGVHQIIQYIVNKNKGI